jgi:hypothetical protein
MTRAKRTYFSTLTTTEFNYFKENGTIPVRSIFNTTNLHPDMLGAVLLTLHQLQKTELQETDLHTIEVGVDFNAYVEEILQGHFHVCDRYHLDRSLAIWRTPAKVSSHHATYHCRCKASQVIRWMRTQGFLVEFNIVGFNNHKKLWETSQVLDGPYTPRFRDEVDASMALDTSMSGASEKGSYIAEYNLIDEVDAPMPVQWVPATSTATSSHEQ